MIIDSHTHLNKANEENDFLDGVKRLIVLADENKVDKIVVIANTVEGTNCASTKEILRSVNDTDRFYVIGSPNVTAERSDINYFEDLLKLKKVIGLKLFPGHEKFYPTDKICEPVYKLAQKYSCPVVIHTGINTGDYDCAKYNDPKYIVDIANKYPSLKIIIAHYFWPKMDYCFDITKNIPNIYYDTSAMADAEVIALSGGVDKVIEVLEKTVKVKPYSVIFGSDFEMCSQREHIDLVNKLHISDKVKTDIYYNNFQKCYGINI